MSFPVLRLKYLTTEEYLRNSSEDSEDGCRSALEFLHSINCNPLDAGSDGGRLVYKGYEVADFENEDGNELIPYSNNNFPQETQCSRSDSGTNNDGYADEQSSAEITHRLVRQVEVMFSDEYLAKDRFLLKHVRRRSDGYVSLKLVAGLSKVRKISKDIQTVLAALRLSLELDVNLDGTKIRRIEPLTTYLRLLPNPSKDRSATFRTTAYSNDELLNFTPEEMTNQQHTKTERNNNNASTGCNNSETRHRGFSKQRVAYYVGTSLVDYFYRTSYVSMSADGSPEVNRFHDGSFPIPMKGPNDERTVSTNNTSESCGACDWLQRRISSRRSAEDTFTRNRFVREPRGPDGTKGFVNSYK